MISMSDEGNRPTFLHAQAASGSVELEVVLSSQRAYTSFRLLTDQRTIVQRPRDRGFGNSSQFGDISNRSNGFRFSVHSSIYATDCIIHAAKYFVKSSGQFDKIYVGFCQIIGLCAYAKIKQVSSTFPT